MTLGVNELSPLRIRHESESDQPLVSICCWTHNDVATLRESIESILDQATSFPVEIIIHDDASTDGTSAIVLEYSERYPHLFRNIIHEENQYSQGLSIISYLWTATRSPYVALIHGDDFWCDPLKLQKQFDFLATHPSVCLCGHRFNLIQGDEIEKACPSPFEKERGTIEDILLRNNVHTSTAMYRKSTLNIDSDAPCPSAGDWYMWSKIAQHGDIGFINEVMSIYRIHQGGIASSKPPEVQMRRLLARGPP